MPEILWLDTSIYCATFAAVEVSVEKAFASVQGDKCIEIQKPISTLGNSQIFKNLKGLNFPFDQGKTVQVKSIETMNFVT